MGEIPRSSQLESAGFYEMSSEWHAYWIGFLAADGCVFVDEKGNCIRVSVHLQASDADHLRNLQAGLKTSNTVRIHSNGQYPSAVFSVACAQFAAAIARWGVVPNKTLTMDWPTRLPSASVPAYIRGYFDGDGTAYQRHRSAPGTTWTETTCRFIYWQRSFFRGTTAGVAVTRDWNEFYLSQ